MAVGLKETVVEGMTDVGLHRMADAIDERRPADEERSAVDGVTVERFDAVGLACTPMVVRGSRGELRGRRNTGGGREAAPGRSRPLSFRPLGPGVPRA